MIFALVFLGALLLNVDVSSAKCAFFHHHWYKPMGWCGGAQLLIGDINGDKRSDLLCHNSKGNKWISWAKKAGTFRTTDWHKGFGWCGHKTGQVLLGDFNGDGKQDMLCHDTKSGYKWIAYANKHGAYTGTNWHRAMGWCAHKGSELLIGDFNGDGKDDLLCHDRRTGYKWISYANKHGQFITTSWHANMRWCAHAGSKVHIGDFNGDGKADLLCHDNKGNIWYSLANCDGHFQGTTWKSNSNWCGGHIQLLVADYNGDGRSDLLCHQHKTGKKWISYSLPHRRRVITDWYRDMKWCTHAGSQLLTGDFNGDRKADIMCHDGKGNKWISYGECY